MWMFKTSRAGLCLAAASLVLDLIACGGGSSHSTAIPTPTPASAYPQDMAVCGSYPGDSSNPFYAQATSGGGGLWNINTSSDLSGLPVSYETPFMTAYQNFIKAVIAHYNGNAQTPIGYIRFGFSQGGEDSPECNQYWPNYSESTYLSYVQTMTNSVQQQGPSMTILADMHAVGPPGNIDYNYADTEAADAVADQFGFGTNGLQQSDVTNFAMGQPCDADWCAEFLKYFSTQENGKPITLSLQTLQWSDPTNVAQTGSLAPVGSFPGLIPFAQQQHANNLELYLADVGLAFDSSNYCSYPHNLCPAISASTYSSAYAQTITNFISAGGRVQALLFPVLTPSSPIYSSFLANVLPNISGVSVAMPWNQIETSQGNYDFSSFDANLQPFITAGKVVNLIVWPATEGGNNDPNNGGSTPAYVFSTAYAEQVGATAP
jgi:hypothetical protein